MKVDYNTGPSSKAKMGGQSRRSEQEVSKVLME
jgi:hypothetical protein